MENIMLIFEQIVLHFLKQMKSNELKGGDKMPSETECKEMFNVSRGTVRKVYDYMLSNEYIFKIHGKGTFVSPNILNILADKSDGLMIKAKARKIALIISSDNSFNERIINGIKQNISKNGWEIEIFHNDTLEQERKIIRDILFRKDIDGTIILPVRVKDEWRVDFYTAVSNKNISIVVVGKPPHGMMASSVSVDDSITVYSMVEEFYKKGCKKVAILHESIEGELVFSNRLRAYYIAMNRYFSHTKEVVFDVNRYNWEQEIEMFLKNENEKTGFIVFNGNTVLPLFNSIKAANKEFKKDVYVIAYGPENNYSFIDKQLSIMQIPKFELGLKAVEMLYEQIVNEKTEYIKNIIFPAKFLEGETC
jgi:DNA-binding LacI/PurR family transcriptional regulator